MASPALVLPRYLPVPLAAAPEIMRLRHACHTQLVGIPDRLLQPLIDEVRQEADTHDVNDLFGAGPVVQDVEELVATILGKPAALLFPTGVMAQQCALQAWSDLGAARSVALHPSSHLVLRENDALRTLTRFEPHLLGDPATTVRLRDLEELAERTGVVLLELPQRETGGHLLPLDELERVGQWASERGSALHLDGARLWEASAAYGLAPDDVTRVFGSAYVSFYKALGAPAGAALVGSEELITHARVWRRRMGGELPALWTVALPVRQALGRLPDVAAWHAYAEKLFAAVQAEPGLAPAAQMPSMVLRVLFDAPPTALAGSVLRTITASGVWLGGQVWQGPGPRTAGLDLHCYAPLCQLEVQQVMDLLRAVRDGLVS